MYILPPSNPKRIEGYRWQSFNPPAARQIPPLPWSTFTPPFSPFLLAEEITQLARFDEHWRVILAGDNSMLAGNLAKRGYLDVLRRRVPLYRLTDLGRQAIAPAEE